MTTAQVIVLATPVFLLLIAIEWAVGRRRGRDTYRLNDALNSIGLRIVSQVVGVFSAALTVGVYALVVEHLAPWQLSADRAAVWVAGLLLCDFCYYWHHRCGHTGAVLGSARGAPPERRLQPEHGAAPDGHRLARGLGVLPADGAAGFPTAGLRRGALVDLRYQYWVHTQHIGRLGAVDRWLCAPSNHRVHHAVNDRYLDRNHGGILLVWDRLFGTFEPEDDAEPCVYGTRGPLRSWNPLRANLQVYGDLVRDSWHTRRWRDKWGAWFRPPGWRPADVAARFPKPAFDVAAVRRHDPPVSRHHALAAGGLFAVLLGMTSLWLWQAHRLSTGVSLACAAVIVLGLCGIGWLCEREGGASGAAAGPAPPSGPGPAAGRTP